MHGEPNLFLLTSLETSRMRQVFALKPFYTKDISSNHGLYPIKKVPSRREMT